MNKKRRIFAMGLIALMVLGMASCMNSIPCPAYATTNQKTQNNKG